MKCLLVIAHPLSGSLNATLAETAAEAIRAAGHDLRIRNLYAEGFQPALTETERANYYGCFDSAGVAAEAEELRTAEMLVLVFPTWWFSFPAMLKGWFDRVWAPGIAYDHAPDLGTITPRLHKLREVVAITTLGAPWWVDWLILRQPVKRVLKIAILKFCAPQARLQFLSVYNAEKLGPAGLAKAEQKIKTAIARL